jgi:hypothetical protein
MDQDHFNRYPRPTDRWLAAHDSGLQTISAGRLRRLRCRIITPSSAGKYMAGGPFLPGFPTCGFPTCGRQYAGPSNLARPLQPGCAFLPCPGRSLFPSHQAAEVGLRRKPFAGARGPEVAPPQSNTLDAPSHPA